MHMPAVFKSATAALNSYSKQTSRDPGLVSMKSSLVCLSSLLSPPSKSDKVKAVASEMMVKLVKKVKMVN